MRKINTLFIALALTFSVVSCEEDENKTLDITSPVITFTSPAIGETYVIGDSFKLKATITDEVGLGSWSWSCSKTASAKKKSEGLVNKHDNMEVLQMRKLTTPYRWHVSGSMEVSGRTANITEESTVRELVELGEYTIIVNAEDAAGNRSTITRMFEVDVKPSTK